MKPCVRVIEMDAESSLDDLHEAIQDAVAFDRDHLYEFYIANSASFGARRDWVTMEEEWEDRLETFSNTPILEVLPPTGRKRLYYLFDPGDKWTFEVRKVRGQYEPEPGAKYPRVVEAEGPNPKQY
jgi:hypothetical protein